jgi:hypothetical protein
MDLNRNDWNMILESLLNERAVSTAAVRGTALTVAGLQGAGAYGLGRVAKKQAAKAKLAKLLLQRKKAKSANRKKIAARVGQGLLGVSAANDVYNSISKKRIQKIKDYQLNK